MKNIEQITNVSFQNNELLQASGNEEINTFP